MSGQGPRDTPERRCDAADPKATIPRRLWDTIRKERNGAAEPTATSRIDGPALSSRLAEGFRLNVACHDRSLSHHRGHRGKQRVASERLLHHRHHV